MNFQPLGEHVLIERVQESNTTASGIYIPDNAKEKPSQGKVMAISSEVKEIAVGDTAVFGMYVGSELTLDGTQYIVLETKDILGLIK